MYKLTGVTRDYRKGRGVVHALLEKLWRDHHLTMVLVTHDSSVARRAERLGFMKNGKLSIKQDTRRASTKPV